jgi:DNA-binding SARP family transcriptional activator
VHLSVFGPFAAERNGVPIGVPTGKAEVLCRMLTAAHGAVVAVDEVAAALWPDDEPYDVVRLVRPLISRLRRVLGADCIIATPLGWRLDSASVVVDAWTLETLAHDAHRALHASEYGAALAAAEAALKLMARGEPLVADRYAEWAQPFRRRAAGLARELRRVGWASAMHLGAYELARALAETSIDEDPLDEVAWRDLMRTLIATGRNALALRAYSRLRETLADELGASPSVDTEALYLSLLDGRDIDRALERELTGAIPVQLTS